MLGFREQCQIEILGKVERGGGLVSLVGTGRWAV